MAEQVEVNTTLFEPGQPIETVSFPITGVVSLVLVLQAGAAVEVATVGNEGILGVPVAAGGSLMVRGVQQVAGLALRMSSDDFRRAVDRCAPLRTVVDLYVQNLFGQLAQAVACARLHSNESRFSRWLLTRRDQLGVDTFTATHQAIGQMLGSRRATVSGSAGNLQSAGLIRYHRGRVTIVDGEGLEALACECYATVRQEFNRPTNGSVHRDVHRDRAPRVRAPALKRARST